jgi:hypothetical protein
MFKKIIRAIHYLRVYFLVFITISFFYYLGLQPVNVSKFIGAKMGRAVGMSISVPENPFNHLALQLDEKQSRLAVQENDLEKRELALTSINSGPQYKLIIVLATGIVVLFILILLNFYFDYRRRKQSGFSPSLKS